MKNTLKLAAIAVSVVLAMSFIACSDSVDDIEDATTPEYLLTAKSDSFIASLKYNQNVKDDDITSLTETYKGITKIGDGCAKCRELYFNDLKGGYDEYCKNQGYDKDYELTSEDITNLKDALGDLKTKFGKENYHKFYVYKEDVQNAIDDLHEAEAKVDAIADINKDKLNGRQNASISACLDAAAALKAVLSENDAKKCATKIKAADDAIEAFNKLETVNEVLISTLTKMVDAMADDIQKNVVNEITL